MTSDFTYTLKTSFNKDLIRLDLDGPGIVDDARQRIYTQIVRLQDQEIRRALIELGWTPPPQPKDPT